MTGGRAAYREQEQELDEGDGGFDLEVAGAE